MNIEKMPNTPLLTVELPFLTVPRRSWLRNSSLDNWMSRLTAQSPAYRSPSPYSSVYEDKSSEMKREETNCILCILHWRLLCLVVREVEWLSSNLSWAGLGKTQAGWPDFVWTTIKSLKYTKVIQVEYSWPIFSILNINHSKIFIHKTILDNETNQDS